MGINEISGRMEGFRFTAPAKHYGLFLDGFVTFHGSEESMRKIASQIENGERGPVRSVSLICIEITVADR